MKKMISLILCTILLTGFLGACQSNAPEEAGTTSTAENTNQTEQGDDQDESSAMDFSQHETFSLWLISDPNDYYSDYSENPIVRMLNEKFNVTLEYQQPATGTEADSLSLMFGTGEYTDLVDLSTYTGSVTELYTDGVIIDISQYLDYMPHLKNLLDTDEVYRKACYNDNGQILTLLSYTTNDDLAWGGMVYRRDILETMTDGNIQFPSGNDIPTTIDDWDYMLPLYVEYFESQGLKEYAGLILPSEGYFVMGEIASGFGGPSSYYVEDGVVKHGVFEDGFYHYLQKMNEWYEKGYIYQDFASRTNDMFIMPNTALTYGGAAGIWYGLQAQLGDAMSVPDSGLYFDVQPVTSPIDTANGVTIARGFNATPKNTSGMNGSAITTACENIPKLLSVLDYMYSEEGGMYFSGLTKEQGADTDPIYAKAGLQDGTYWFDENGEFVYNPLITYVGGTISIEPFGSNRIPSRRNNTYLLGNSSDILKYADEIWMGSKESNQGSVPPISYSPEDEITIKDNDTKISDYLRTSIPKFIMGTMPLDDDAWAEFKGQLVSLGLEENLEIRQEAYERYLNR